MIEIKSKKELDRLIREKGIKCHRAEFNGSPEKDYYYYYIDSIYNEEYKINRLNKNL